MLLLVLSTVAACSGSSSELTSYRPNVQDDDALTTALVNSLSSTTDQIRTDSEKKLIDFARISSARRELVINKLLSSVKAEKELDGTHTILETSFPYWQSVTNIFAELNATEAVDVLINCVQCGNGWSGTMGEPPASFALVRMGTPILPRLSKALSQESVPNKRAKIVLCIARIGGSEAISFLEQALRSESDREVRKVIKFGLSGMKSNH